ncbi:MAG TPA: type IV pilus assembly protein PilM [bacterium]|nr:type IV pilus assembly protein PilM [bacterium]
MGLHKHRTSVGLDLGSHTLKAVEVVPADGKFKISRVALAPTPAGAVTEGVATDPALLAPAIRALLDEGGIRTKRVVTAVGGEAVIIRELKLPEMPQVELERAVAFEAERYLPAGVQDVSRDFQVLGKSSEEKQLDILLVAARKELVDRQLAPLRAVGLSSSVMEVTSFSMVRAFETNGSNGSHDTGESHGDATVYVDLGAESSDIIVMEGDRLRLARNIPIGGNAVTKAIAEAMSVEFDAAQTLKERQAQLFVDGERPEDMVLQHVHEAMLPVLTSIFTEVRRSMDFYTARSRGQAIAKVVLTGGTAKLKNLARYLGDELGVPVEVGNPFETHQVDAGIPPEHLADVGPMMAVAVGLALRGARER